MTSQLRGDASDSPARQPSRVARLLPLVGPSLLIVLILRLDVAALWSAFSRTIPWIAALAFAVFLANVWSKALRWSRIVHRLQIPLDRRTAALEYLVSAFYGAVTPARLGELTRIQVLRRHNARFGMAAFGAVVDRVADLVVLALVSLIAAIPTLVATGRETPGLASALVALLVVGVALVARRIVDRLGGAHGLAEAMHGLSRPAALAELLVWTVAANLAYFGSILLVARSLRIETAGITVVSCFAAAALVGLVPITFQGLGTREATLVLFLGLEGVPAETAVAFGLASFLVFLCGTLLLGALAFPARRRLSRRVSSEGSLAGSGNGG